MTSSFRRKPEGAFTLQVQRLELLTEHLRRSPVPQAFTWCMVVRRHQRIEITGLQCGEIGLARQAAAHATDGILDPAFLPWGMRIAEVGSHAELPVEPMVQGELGTVVEGHALSQW